MSEKENPPAIFSADLNYNPLRYFWIAEYPDGRAFPQFDIKTGRENLWRDVKHSEVVKLGWYPFGHELAMKVIKASGKIVMPTRNTWYAISLADIPPEERVKRIVLRRFNLIHYSKKSGNERGRETFYLLGIKKKKVIKINEIGKIVDVRK